MKNLSAKLLIVCSLAAPATGFAADWKSDGADGYYDASSIVREGDFVRVWMRVDGKGMQLYSIDCKNNTGSLRASFAYGEDRPRDNLRKYGGVSRYTPIVPGTRGEKIAAKLCKPWYWPF